jgi:tetratricopeptide (TPR) repeat protein
MPGLGRRVGTPSVATARGGARPAAGPPGPDGAGTVRELVERLRLLRAWAGMSYRAIHRQMVRSRQARRVADLPALNTVYRCFQPARTRLDVELVVDVAAVLLGDRAAAEQWRQSCQLVAGRAGAAAVVEVAGQLPDDLPAFTGRRMELDRLTSPAAETSTEMMVAAIHGMPGIGKTRLAVHAGHLLLGQGLFADLQLAVDLRGYDPSRPPADPAAVLEGFLRRLGMRGDQIDHLDLAGRSARYRQLLAGKRALVLLDNAAAAEQVKPLLPDAHGCLALITTRQALADLPGAVHLSLDVFTPDEAVELLRRTADAVRVEADLAATTGMAGLLGHLPLALAVAAAWIRANPDWSMADHFERLLQHRDRLRLADEVEVALGLSYAGLPAELKRTFRLLALLPGGDLDPHAAAALADAEPAAMRRQLDRLATHSLLLHPTPGRYAFHDLVRVYATGRAHDEDAASARREALGRLLDHYLHSAAAAVEVVLPGEPARPECASPRRMPMRFGDLSGAAGWLEVERANLVAAGVFAARSGWPEHAGELSTVLARYLGSQGRHDDVATLAEHAVAAARQTGDPTRETAALGQLGTAYRRLGRVDEATQALERALSLAEAAGDHAVEADLRARLTAAHLNARRYGEAVRHGERAVILARASADPRAEAGALINLGVAHDDLGRYREAMRFQQEAMAVGRRVGSRTHECIALANLGDLSQRLGRLDEAAEQLQQALAISEKMKHELRIYVLHSLGLVAAKRGEHTGAVAYLRQSLLAAEAAGHHYWQARALTGLGCGYARLHRYDEADRHHRGALRTAQERGLTVVLPLIQNGLGELALLRHDPPRSVEHHTAALAGCSDCHHLPEAARAHHGLGAAHHALGHHRAAHRQWQCALAIYAELDVPEAKTVRALLTSPAASARNRPGDLTSGRPSPAG